MLLLSAVNLVAAATVAGSTQDAVYIDDNAKSPQRPFLPWRTTVATGSALVIDFGSAKVVTFVLLVHVNYTSVTIEGNATDSWGAPSYSAAITVTRNPLMWRYQAVHLPVGFNFRYMRLAIPTQTPTDGAAYFSTGGVWAGATLTPPRHYEVNARYRTVQPRGDVGPKHGGWRQRLLLGEPLVRMIVAREARVTEDNPLAGDELDTWMEIERQLVAGDFFAFFPNLADASQGYVMRSLGEGIDWEMRDAGLAVNTWELEEVTGP